MTPQQKWNRQHPDKLRAATARYRERYPERIKIASKTQKKDWHLRQRYGITLAQAEAMVTRQYGRCLGCRNFLNRCKRGYNVDHDHHTGKVRGILCPQCNIILGLAKDSKTILRNLMTYLDYDQTKWYVYIIGALKNPRVPEVAAALRLAGYEALDEWHAASPDADTCWQNYSLARNQTFAEALHNRAAENTFHFDRSLIDLADYGVLVAPGGKSAHLELGYMAGQGKQTFILLDQEPDRYDVMPQFAKGVFSNTEDLIQGLKSCA